MEPTRHDHGAMDSASCNSRVRHRTVLLLRGRRGLVANGAEGNAQNRPSRKMSDVPAEPPLTHLATSPVEFGRTRLIGDTSMTNDSSGDSIPLGASARSYGPVMVILPGTSVSGRTAADESLPMNVCVMSGSNSSVNVPRASGGTSMISVAKYHR